MNTTSLYEINGEIRALLDKITDTETGEVTGEANDFELLAQLQMDRQEKIEALLCYIKNLVAQSKMLKDEENAIAERRKPIDNKIDRLTKYAERELAGEKFFSPKAEATYRKSNPVEYDSEFLAWALKNCRNDLLSFSNPTPNKTAIKQAIKNGEVIEHAEIVEKMNMTIK